jgi:excisionase family DNA binding protein
MRMTVRHAATFLGVSIATIRRLIRQGRLPYYRVRERIILTQDDLQAYLLAQRVPSRTTEGPPHENQDGLRM